MLERLSARALTVSSVVKRYTRALLKSRARRRQINPHTGREVKKQKKRRKKDVEGKSQSSSCLAHLSGSGSARCRRAIPARDNCRACGSSVCVAKTPSKTHNHKKHTHRDSRSTCPRRNTHTHTHTDSRELLFSMWRCASPTPAAAAQL